MIATQSPAGDKPFNVPLRRGAGEDGRPKYFHPGLLKQATPLSGDKQRQEAEVRRQFQAAVSDVKNVHPRYAEAGQPRRQGKRKVIWILMLYWLFDRSSDRWGRCSWCLPRATLCGAICFLWPCCLWRPRLRLSALSFNLPR